MRLRALAYYIVTMGVFSVMIYFIIQNGEKQEVEKVTKFVPQLEASTWDQFKETYHHNVTHPLAILLLQIITIIIVARFFGFICKKIRQPQVVGEMAAGIFLGPSFIGTYVPEFSSFLFPAESLPNLQFLSQIGLILFMFVVGMELDLRLLQNRAHEAVVISHASIIIPFAMGMGLAYYMYLDFAPENVKFLSFSLFMGIAMSITAFPVLARIIQERGLTKTRVGAIAITCAAADDVTAWCLLAVVIAVVKAGSFLSALYTILIAIVYVIIMLKLVRPFLKKMGDAFAHKEGLSKPVVAIFFITLLLSSYATEVIGIHALFGAFMAGVIMPSNMSFRAIFIEKVEDVSQVLLLPLFFVFTGLRTQIGLINNTEMWTVCGLIILVAVSGKFLGSALSARFVGQSWRDSLVIGALMNTRGLMELVVLNIGFDLGVLSPGVFSMMVIMALVTTIMTGPLLDIINWFSKTEAPSKKIPDRIKEHRKFRILVSFGNPERGKNMLQIANCFIKKTYNNSNVTALHLSPSNELNQFNTPEYENDSFQPIREEAERLKMPVFTMFKPAQDIDREIVNTANNGNFDLTLIGAGHSIYEGTFLGKILGFTTRIINPERLYDTITGKEKLFANSVFDERTRQMIKSVKSPVGIYVNKNFHKADHVFIPIFSLSDSFLLIYAQKLIHNNESRVSIFDVTGAIKVNPELKEAIRSIEHASPQHIALYNDRKIEKDFLSNQDLMLISMDSWQKAIESQSVWLANTPSALIIKP